MRRCSSAIRTPFDLFRNVLLPEKLAENAGSRRLRIWCAAVSTGQEAYSLAMILDEMAPSLVGWTVEILGTDISEEVLTKARRGVYTQFEVQRGLPMQMLLRHFSQTGENWQIAERIRNMVELRPHNLLESSARFGQFDIIFCRNVLIYFDVRHQGQGDGGTCRAADARRRLRARGGRDGDRHHHHHRARQDCSVGFTASRGPAAPRPRWLCRSSPSASSPPQPEALARPAVVLRRPRC